VTGSDHQGPRRHRQPAMTPSRKSGTSARKRGPGLARPNLVRHLEHPRGGRSAFGGTANWAMRADVVRWAVGPDMLELTFQHMPPGSSDTLGRASRQRLAGGGEV
jgi:hypothetical protein